MRSPIRLSSMRYRLALGVLAALLPASYAAAKRVIRDFEIRVPSFELAGKPLGTGRPARVVPAYLTASRISAAGDGALAIDADSGALLRTDRSGKLVAQLAIGEDAGLLAFDPIAGLAYVADRRGDRVVVVSAGDRLAVASTMKTPAEPYAVALAPDRKTLLVAAIADRALVALDTATGAERWRAPLGREPRGLAISPDGSRALVSYLLAGTVDQVSLRDGHRVEQIALAMPTSPRVQQLQRAGGSDGTSYARASFAVTFMGADEVVVPFQRETPVQQRDGVERRGSYGGGFEPPVSQQLAFISTGGPVGTGKLAPQATAQIAQNQPRALAWDGKRDALYVAGLGSDAILHLKDASTSLVAEGGTVPLTFNGERCGPDGLAISPDGDVLVWCSFTRGVHRVVPARGKVEAPALERGPSLIASRLSPAQHDGLVLFHAADMAIALRGAMACATCHPDNRTDGLTWRIDRHELQTPILAGRVVNTHPYKWDGEDKDLTTSLTNTMRRLGGRGLDGTQTGALVAYISNLPSVRAPARDAAMVARGKALFDSAKLGCRSCHDGAALTDQARHKLTSDLPESDTPSLLGLAASAPYYHDGSAATVEDVLRERGKVHGMAETAHLPEKDLADLVAFLETL